MSNNDMNNLTEEQVEEISKALEEVSSDNENIQKIKEIEAGGHEEAPAEDIEEDVLDNELFMPEDDTKGVDLYQASMDAYDRGESYMLKAVDDISKKFNLNMADIHTLINISKRYKAKEKFSIYNALPDSVKEIISTQIVQTGNVLNNQSKALFCEIFMDEFVSEFVDKYFDKEIVDFNKSIETTLGSITNVADMYAGHIRYMMEVELKKKAEETDNEDAKAIYLGCSKAFTDSYTYNKMIYTINFNSKARRKMYKDNFQYKRFCDDFNYRNKDTKYSIRNVEQMTDALVQHLGKELNITIEDAKAFTILFIKTTTNMDMHKLVDSMYIYYSIFNIINLGFDTSKSKFYHVIVNNIKKVFNEMWASCEYGCGKTPFEIEEDIDWVGDEPTPEEMEAFAADLNKDNESNTEEDK